jgi:hypothetical protein
MYILLNLHGEFELASVMTFCERRIVRMVFSEVNKMFAGVRCGMPALLTHVYLVPPLFVGVIDVHVVHFATMRFQGTSLRE